ncbi:MAG: DUF4252 domain-containing protein [Alistipes sp.]|nr:DUF4252 domain-containing protein [Alistipes sp.]MBR4046572.1 DUF4252 domain-containing protein [Alistipes sp.]
MKRLILLILICLPIAASAQTDHMAPLIKKYSTFKDCSTVVLSKEMLNSMYADTGINSMQAISVEDPSLLNILKNDIEKFIDGYALLMSVNSDGTNVEIYRVEQYYKSEKTGKRESFDDYIIIAISSTEGVVIRLTGDNIKLEDATSLISI